MLGTLFGLVGLVFGVVRRYDPEARRPPAGEGGAGEREAGEVGEVEAGG
jgi:hypothetical protein